MMFQTILSLYDVFVGDVFDPPPPTQEWKSDDYSTDPYFYLKDLRSDVEKTDLQNTCNDFQLKL